LIHYATSVVHIHIPEEPIVPDPHENVVSVQTARLNNLETIAAIEDTGQALGYAVFWWGTSGPDRASNQLAARPNLIRSSSTYLII